MPQQRAEAVTTLNITLPHHHHHHLHLISISIIIVVVLEEEETERTANTLLVCVWRQHCVWKDDVAGAAQRCCGVCRAEACAALCSASRSR